MRDPDQRWDLDVRGLRLSVADWGRAEDGRPPVICLHGWLDQGLAFAGMVADRPGRWLALDQRGFGRSDHAGPGGYPHFLHYVADVHALIEALGGGPVDLVGHSMGGTVASMVAGTLPDQVRRLVVVEGLGALPRWTHGPVDQLRRHLQGLRAPPEPAVVEDVAAAAARIQRRHPGLEAAHALALAEHGTVALPDGRRRWSYDPLHMTRAAYPFVEETYLSFLREIRAPTLLVWGEESWYPAELRERRGAAIAHHEVVELPGAHMLPYTAPRALGDAVEAHLCPS